MTMTLHLNHGPIAAAAICERFRQAAYNDVARLSGDRAAMVLYLAKTHDLTKAEAADTLDDCLTLRTTRLGTAA